jgi:hypothetical protein
MAHFFTSYVYTPVWCRKYDLHTSEDLSTSMRSVQTMLSPFLVFARGWFETFWTY